MSFALPVVAAAIHAVPAIVRAGWEALLAPLGDSLALVGAIAAERVLPGHLMMMLELVPALAEVAPKIPPLDFSEQTRAVF